MCSAAAEILDGGVGLSLAIDDSLTPVGATEDAREGERLQADLGEGPCYDAWHTSASVASPDVTLATPWLVLGPALARAGHRAVFAFPLTCGGVRLGAMTAYRPRPGLLTDAEHADGVAIADLAGGLLVGLPGDESDQDLLQVMAGATTGSWVVHQACGMVAVQLDVGVGDAMARLRAYAFAVDATLEDVASEVVARRLRFDEDA